MMLFAARVVEKRLIGLMMINIGVIGFVFILLSMILPSLQSLTMFFFAVLILIVIIAAIIYKGDLSSYQLENALFIFPGEMQICHIIFPMNEIDDLRFCFRSFNGMVSGNTANNNYDGLNNQITFKYRNQDFYYNFFLENQQHFFQFIIMLEQLYIQQIPFEETNLRGKTFMMKNVNEAEYHHLKKKYQPF